MNYQLLKSTLKRHEGYRNKPYKDSVGKLTIGIGHNLDDLGVDDEVIEHQFLIDIERAVEDCKTLFGNWHAIPSNKQTVLANMMFNMGLPVLSKFTKTISFIDASDWANAADEMLDSKWAKQVGNRATELANIMRADL